MSICGGSTAYFTTKLDGVGCDAHLPLRRMSSRSRMRAPKARYDLFPDSPSKFEIRATVSICGGVSRYFNSGCAPELLSCAYSVPRFPARCTKSGVRFGYFPLVMVKCWAAQAVRAQLSPGRPVPSKCYAASPLTQENGMIETILALAIGFGAGCMFYRYMLQRDPAKLEAWAKTIREKTQGKP